MFLGVLAQTMVKTLTWPLVGVLDGRGREWQGKAHCLSHDNEARGMRNDVVLTLTLGASHNDLMTSHWTPLSGGFTTTCYHHPRDPTFNTQGFV